MMQDIVVELVLERFNLCLCELMQFEEDAPEDRTHFLRKMLCKIRDGHVASAHMNSEEAQHAIDMLDHLLVEDKEHNHGKD